MTAARPRTLGPVAWLGAQAVAFGVTAALLGIAANAMFLDAYGASWLPVTYIAIGFAGVALSGMVARGAGSGDPLGMMLVVLGGAAAILAGAWVVATATGDPWVSAPLLVLFPILIQLGFVFIGSQAGRLLDIAGIKSQLPRIMAGFPVGAVGGGLAGGPLVTLLGRTEDLLLVAAGTQAVFAALVWGTARRHPTAPADAAPARPAGHPSNGDAGAGAVPGSAGAASPSLGSLLRRRFVVAILAYQVLSALGSQLSDYLVFDRASVQFGAAEDLARFIAGYTAVMNAVTIAFMLVLAGPLLRRWGLRLGIAANPVVVGGFAVLMVVALAAGGPGSVALLAVVSATRIADIALSDGTTRTSINAMYQVLPERIRLAAQAVVEGMGVPIAIGVSGVLVLALQAVPGAPAAMIAATAVTCVAWTLAAVALDRLYAPALADALRRRPLLDPDAVIEATAQDEMAARRLLVAADVRRARLGVEVMASVSTPGATRTLARLASDPDPDVRVPVLAALAAAGDRPAADRLEEEIRAAADSGEVADRMRAAAALASLGTTARRGPARTVLVRLLDDPAAEVRRAALDAVGGSERDRPGTPGDGGGAGPGETPAGLGSGVAGEALAERVVALLDDPACTDAAALAVGRLGDLALPVLAVRLDGAATSPASRSALRLARACRAGTPAGAALLARHVRHPDRTVGHLVMRAAAGPGPAMPALAAELDGAFGQDVEHAGRVRRAIDACDRFSAAGAPGPGGEGAAWGLLRRALEEELDVVRDRLAAGRLARYGSGRLGTALAEARTAAGASPLAVEAVEVALGPADARWLIALLRPGGPGSERGTGGAEEAAGSGRRGGPAPGGPAPGGRAPGDRSGPASGPRDLEAWLRDLVEDPDATWRSPWLRACAVHLARVSGRLLGVDLGAARSLGDAVVDEELAAAAAGS